MSGEVGVSSDPTPAEREIYILADTGDGRTLTVASMAAVKRCCPAGSTAREVSGPLWHWSFTRGVVTLGDQRDTQPLKWPSRTVALRGF